MKLPSRLLCLCVLCYAASLEAKNVSAGPPHPTILVVPHIQNPDLAPINVRSGDAEIRISGLLARTTVTYTVANPNSRALEAEFQFPLPPGATVTGLALDVEGKMLDAAILPKAKAKTVFEAVERRNLDPALVESIGANTYRVRVWPVPAHGIRKVRIEFVSELIPEDREVVFTFPMRFTEKLESMRLRVIVANPDVPPVLTGNAFAGMHFDKWENQLAAERTLRDIVLSEDLRIAVPYCAVPVQFEKADDGVYFRAELPYVRKPSAVRPISDKIVLVWDASFSRRTQDHQAEFALLKAFFAGRESEIVLYTLRDILSAPTKIHAKNGDVSALLSELEKTVYDGGTNLAALRQIMTGKIPTLVFTDGVDNFGPGIGVFGEKKSDATVDFITCTSQANTGVLAYLARLGQGHALNLTRMTPEAAAEKLRSVPEAMPEVAVTTEGKSIPAEVRINGGFLTVAGKVAPETKSLTLAGQTIPVDAAKIASGRLLRTAWALMRLESMQRDPRTDEEDFIRHGQTFGIVTPGTSMLVLDSYELYWTHHVRPPASLAQWRARYDREVPPEKSVVKDMKIVMKRYLEEIGAWYSAIVPAKRPSQQRVLFREVRGLASGAPDVGASGAPNMGASGAPNMGAPAEASTSRLSSHLGGLEGNQMESWGWVSLRRDTSDTSLGSTSWSAPTTVKVNTWDSNAPYLVAMRMVGVERAYAVYLEYRDREGESVGLFTDCADFFRRAKRPELAQRILSNLAEMRLESVQVLRVLGMRLRLAGDLPAAERVYRKILRLAPEEPQSLRDLALTLDDAGRFAEAAELYLQIIKGDFDRRFPGVDFIAITELNRVAARAERAGKKLDLDPILRFPLNAALRVVLVWDADLSDMDLHVTDPWQEDCFYGNRRTVGGGHLSFDFTQGYGPEEFMTRKLIPGKYRIWAHYYGENGVKRIGPVTLYAVIYTGYGTPEEKLEILTFRLGTRNERLEIATIDSGTAAVSAPEAMRDYQVKSGDTLYSIAVHELGDGGRVKEIVQLNHLTSDLIRVGDILKLPANFTTKQ